MTNFPPANRTRAWYADNYRGSKINPNVVVLHTTEGTTLPTYSGGGSAPHYTAVPDMKAKRLNWFAHFPDEMSARALQNDAGGVETNTLNCIQVELVGTCAPGTRDAWRKAGRSFIYWPEAPEWALEEVAEFAAWAHRTHGIRLEGAPVWLAYPRSYGNTEARFSGTEWSRFYGFCGHQHVPENDHGDPGNLNWARIETLARELVGLDVEDDEPEAREPKVIDASRCREAFMAAMDQDLPPASKRCRIHVLRLQKALNAKYPDADLRETGMVDQKTLKAWARHESVNDGSGRPTLPDVKALRALVSPRFTVRP